MIGFRITATGYDEDINEIHREVYSGWREGDPDIEEKAGKAVAKQLRKYLVNKGTSLVVGGPVKGVATVVEVVSAPLAGMGEGAMKHIVAQMKRIDHLRVSHLLNAIDLRVILSGDFEGEYIIKNQKDLVMLPTMLDLVSERSCSERFMGAAVKEKAIAAHHNFIRDYCRRPSFAFDGKRQNTIELDLEIKL